MHRTCIINWMETRCCEACHACPMCRATIGELQGEDAPGQRVRAYGDHGQPTKRTVWRSSGIETNGHLLPFLDKAEAEIDTTIREINASLAQLVDHRNCGCRDNDDYTQDIHEELAKLRRRAQIYVEMRRAFSEGGMRWWQINMRTIDTKPWSYEAEMEDLEDTRQEEEAAFNNGNNPQRSSSPMIQFAELVVVNQPLQEAVVILSGATVNAEEVEEIPRAASPAAEAAAAAPSARDQRAAARDARRHEADEEREEDRE
ncbi:hypothetical protein PRIPAC_82484 [Pristionchus pacificus]|uniref:Uncharacterized protein n=1 Tax=Pristionchus pacificus TaxID=54126 RepID=A0A2A6BVW1_PRIPA|nr:hypothetical protein PRIPAC_82484 [Pristionchus pacificus]|eukprot:PDM70007.1 hypothetical protein PRIPAC_49219 [Pristionchus pacificus]